MNERTATIPRLHSPRARRTRAARPADRQETT